MRTRWSSRPSNSSFARRCGAARSRSACGSSGRSRPEDYRLNLTALASYRDQLKGLRGFRRPALDVSAAPGVAGRRRGRRAGERRPRQTTGPRSRASWPKRSPSSRPAAPRRARPWPMSCAASGRAIREHLNAIAERGPQVVQDYAGGFAERIQALVQEQRRDRRAQGRGPRDGDSGRPLRHQRRDRPAARPPEPVSARSSTSPRVRAGSSSSSCRRWARDQHDRLQGERRARSAARSWR